MGVKVKERPEGSGIWWIFIDHSGKRKAKKIGKNKRVAMEAAKKIEAKLTLGEMNLNESPRPPTLKEYIDGWRDGAGEKKIGWYEKVAVLSLKHSTYCSYRLIIDLHLIPLSMYRYQNRKMNGR